MPSVHADFHSLLVFCHHPQLPGPGLVSVTVQGEFCEAILCHLYLDLPCRNLILFLNRILFYLLNMKNFGILFIPRCSPNKNLSPYDLKILKPSNSLYFQGMRRKAQDWTTSVRPHQSLSSFPSNSPSSSPENLSLLSGSRVVWLFICLPIYWLGHGCNSESLQTAQRSSLWNSHVLSCKTPKHVLCFF